MEHLREYVQNVRQHGLSDDQIRANLIASGWEATQVDSALGYLQSKPPIHQPRIAPKRINSRWVIGIAAVLLLLVAAGGPIVYSSLHTTPSPPPSITFYYNDSKTVLWQDNNPGVAPAPQSTKAPYFVALVSAELRQKYGSDYWKQGAWKVTTSLDAGLQASAEQLVANNLSNLTARTAGRADEEVTTLQDVQTGQIKALVGGADRSNPDYGQTNYATIPVSPGSSIKPFDYAALIENTTNIGAGSVIADKTTSLPGYPCTDLALPAAGGNCLADYDFLQPGNMPIRYALGSNRNIPAVEAMLGSTPSDNSPDSAKSVDQVINLVDKMGVQMGYNCYSDAANTKTTQCYEASAIGDGAFLTVVDELHALSTFANMGKKVPQTTIVSVMLNGKVKAAWRSPVGQQVVRPDTAYIINDIMSDPNASYLPGSCTTTTCTALSDGGYKFQRDNGWHFAVDSGISSDGFDATMASWSAKYAVVSWVGNHMRNVDISSTGATAESLTEPLTRGLMEAAHTTIPPTTWLQPNDIKTLPAFVLTNHIHYGDLEPSPAIDLYPSWYRP